MRLGKALGKGRRYQSLKSPKPFKNGEFCGKISWVCVGCFNRKSFVRNLAALRNPISV